MSLYGLIGSGIGADPARQIHKRIMQEAGLSGVYSVFDVDGEQSAIEAVKRFVLDGANIGVEFEKSFISRAKPVGAAAATGRMDTLSIVNGELYGYDTLGDSFIAFCEAAGIATEEKEFCVLGSSLSAEAISRALLQNGAKKVINATPEDTGFLDDGYCVINTLGEDIAITGAKFEAALDLKYGRVKPKLAKCAKRYADGLYMQLARAMAAQEIWQRQLVERRVAEKIFLEMRGCARLLLIGIQPRAVKTAASALAQRCGLAYKDMDALMENIPTDQSTAADGRDEEQKREKERNDALMAIYRAACTDKNTVVACGRALLYDKQGMEYFRQCGFVNVFIDRSLEKIAAEMFANNEFYGENGIEELARQHELCEAACAKRLRVDDMEGVADKLFNMLAFDENT